LKSYCCTLAFAPFSKVFGVFFATYAALGFELKRHKMSNSWNSNKKRKWSAEFSVYSKKILMPNTILTLMYNIVKVKRSNTLNKIQTMSVCTINSPELPVLF